MPTYSSPGPLPPVAVTLVRGAARAQLARRRAGVPEPAPVPAPFGPDGQPDLADVAAVARAAPAARSTPRRYVAAAYGVPLVRADRWLRAARDAGLDAGPVGVGRPRTTTLPTSSTPETRP